MHFMFCSQNLDGWGHNVTNESSSTILVKLFSLTIFTLQCSWADYSWHSFFDLLWWFCAASPCLLPVLTRHYPPGQGGWCPHGTFQTSCDIDGELRLAKTGWLSCGPELAGALGPPSWAASSWQCQPWRRHGWATDKRDTVGERKEQNMTFDSANRPCEAWSWIHYRSEVSKNTHCPHTQTLRCIKAIRTEEGSAHLSSEKCQNASSHLFFSS